MGSSKFLRPVLLLAGILSFMQSIVWFIMSLLGVLAYRCEMAIPELSDKISALMYYLYFQGHECEISDQEILLSNLRNSTNATLYIGSLKKAIYANPNMINSWMSSYLAFDITYMFLSIAILVGYCKMKEGYPPYSTIRLWCLNTLVFLILDLWLTIIWGIDYKNLQDFVTKYDVDDSFGWAPSVPGALMAVTARGFLLYVINLTLFIYLVKNALPWNNLRLCCENVSKGYQGERQPAPIRIPRVSTTEPWDNGQVMVPYNSRGYINPAMAQAYYNESRYPQRQYDSGRRRSVENIVHAPTSYDRGYHPQDRSFQPDRRDRDEDFDIIPHSSHQEPSFPTKGHPSARSVFDNKDRKNFEQGHGSPGKPYGQPLRVPPAAKNNDYFY